MAALLAFDAPSMAWRRQARLIGRPLVVALLVGLLCACAHFHTEPDLPFITRDGHRLLERGNEFRFAGLHAPELHRIEDDARGVCPHDPRGWGQYFKWPTPAEQANWIKALTRSGHRAMRVYTLSVATPWDAACERETHILAPVAAGGMPRLNERAMVAYDWMIALAHRYRLRLILPVIDHWQWWGGRAQLAAFYGEEPEDFYRTDSQTYRAYLSVIEQLIQRKNTVTGRWYKDEPVIMAWETGNELRDSTPAFVATTAAFIKQLDSRHLVVDGTYLKVLSTSLADPNVDIISNHFYTVNNNNHPAQVRADLAAINGSKVYLIGEFGLKGAAGLAEIMQTAVHYDHRGARAAGAFIWGFRGRREAGGFYWHREYTGHYSYHLPGFPDNDANEEQQVIDLTREAQAQMAGLARAPSLPVPEAPYLHAIDDPSANIRWFGSPLGRFYRIERASHRAGPWVTVGDDISDGRNRFDPATDVLFRDATPKVSGRTYYYRIYARNDSGESKASNVQPALVP